ncbi:hypothetical protein SLEP1_g47757 [Rubroshorea leprosula]|uniref:Uncharacterized protein n=1 Tax=Rubroshorea leprosula TaxID=152421 RepID=A0AAV5LRJ4_9ROSI|nr:hypothetical protein SLEP1_g47757 [Rubroshorea leprosula]
MIFLAIRVQRKVIDTEMNFLITSLMADVFVVQS